MNLATPSMRYLSVALMLCLLGCRQANAPANAQPLPAGAAPQAVILEPVARNTAPAILAAAPGLPAVIYNSPYYGFATRADLFFDLRSRYSNLIGFKEFGGARAMTYAAEHITSADDGA